MKKRVALYIRVSTEEQLLNGLSLSAQKKALLDYAKTNDYYVVGIFADEGISARKPMKCRKDLLRLLEVVKQDKIDLILVTKLDRWFRNIKDYNITEEILEQHGCHWKTIYEQYDSSTANGQMVINIMLSVNQAECDRTSERIKAVLNYKRSIGEVTSGRIACFGYKAIDCKLYKDKDTESLVNEMFQYYLSCFSKRKTYTHLYNIYGDKLPPYATFVKLFDRETFAGTVQGIANACEPYITREQFRLIQSVKDSKNQPGKKEHYYFSGLIKCPVCGTNLSGYIKKNKKKNGNTFYYKTYRCYRHQKHASLCSCGMTISENVVEQYMFKNIMPELDCILKMTKENKKRNTEANKIPAVRAEMERLTLLFQKGRVTETYYDTQYEALKAKLDTLSESTAPLVSDNVIHLLSGDWRRLYEQLNSEHKSAFWKSIITEITIDKSHKISGFKFVN